MKTIYFALLCLLSNLAMAATAHVNIHLFLKGVPLQDITIKTADSQATTDDYGFSRLNLQPGQHELQFFAENTAIFTHNLEVTDGELVQLLVDLKVIDDPSPDIHTESSVTKAQQPETEKKPADVTYYPLSGQVNSLETGEPIVAAKVFISGRSGYLQTDENGQFTAQLPHGIYAVSILHKQFSSHVESEVNVATGNDNNLKVELTPSGNEMPEFVVIEPYIEGSLAAVLEQRKDNNSVANYLSMEQISKAGDSTAAGALKRVTGLTLVDGQYIFIRGLGERYSSTLLNGANLPSPDPTRRVVPLDLFPTGIISSIEVQKGYSSHLPAEFGGGSVTLKTITIPDEPFAKIGLSYKNNSQSTGQSGFSYAGGDEDWSGFDDGTRATPDLLTDAISGDTELRPNNPFFDGGFGREELAAIGQSFNNSYDLTPITLDPGISLDLAAGSRFDFAGGQTFGLSAAFEYGDEWSHRLELRRDYVVSSGSELTLDSETLADRTERQINASGFLTTGLIFNENHKISSNLMLLRSTTDLAEVAEGFNEDLGNSRKIFELRWSERDLESLQFMGAHQYPTLADLGLKWQLTNSTATFEEPDNRIYRYDRRSDGVYVFSSRNDSNSRVFRSLEDDAKNIKYDLTLPIHLTEKQNLNVQAGQHWTKKDRNSDIRRFLFEDSGPLTQTIDRSLPLSQILNDDNIVPGGYQIIETTRATDNYFANLDIKASFLNIDYAYADFLRMSIGARKENFSQSVTTFRLFDPNQSPITTGLEDSDWFPAWSSTLLFGKNQVRLNYSQTATRPDFKELSPAQFKDPVLNRNVIGNPDLKVGNIKHYDARWDYYFSDTEFLSLSLFYKSFINPIEIIILPGSTRIISFQNADSADNAGVELEFYKDFSWISPKLTDFYLSTNVAYIESEIKLNTEQASGQTNNTRPLQGQSPYVINFQLGYQNDALGLDMSLLFNEFGARISEAGVSGSPDVYEQPFQQIDFIYGQKFADKWKISFKAKNLLNDDVLFLQGDEISRLYEKGREFSLGISYDFF